MLLSMAFLMVLDSGIAWSQEQPLDDLDQADASAGLPAATATAQDGQSFVKQGRYKEAEAAFLQAIGPLDAVSDEVIYQSRRAVLGLASLYLRTNRLVAARSWLDRLDEAFSARGSELPKQSGALRAKLDARLKPNQVSGSVTLSAGYNSNVAAIDDTEEVDDLLPAGEGSPFVDGDARIQFDHVVNENGDRLRLAARFDGRPYFDVDGYDRYNIDVAGGYVFSVPGTTTEVQALVGYKTRFLDGDNYRRSIYGLVSTDSDLTPQLNLSSAFSVEGIDDDNDDVDGYAVNGTARLRYRFTPSDSVAIALNVRYQDSDVAWESYVSAIPTLSYRHDFALGSLDGFYATAAYAPRFVNYDGPAPSGLGAGITRKDITQQVTFALGRDFEEQWKVEGSISYLDRDSTVNVRDYSATEVGLSVTRRF